VLPLRASPVSRPARCRGSLVGLAVGDALGTTLEFTALGQFDPITDMVGGGPFLLSAGQWTDDTSMALCLAESLVEQRGFDPIDQLRRYVDWWRNGHLSSTGRCFDIGGQTRDALAVFERSGASQPLASDPRRAGNGSIMRLAPVAIAYANNLEAAVEHSARSSVTTHPAPQAVDACKYLGALLCGALTGTSKDELLDESF
jgi:ADP-ribosylglycohydrolase